ncbi:MAG: DUF86 domain-containing protein [Microcystis aeruginosa K13-10]|jgi:uncharacterized protein with HEPN domain|uniref:HepT-like ribonuclease domain-containing protein n=1 Tax=Microcystis sp. LE19-41.2A TaxID=3016427 RepID=UPI0022C02004|nr:DUF86 domain-containing protein [Microcystis sp. LE19-41.2A]MCZ8048843.1 DUF86 domain-containing protein [Microcystis sp. LE19-41.2A]NCR82183.1 DUF86 domain-containing protein [Microcystis aeruginosa K13-10]
MRDDTERLRDILEAIERVEKYAPQGKTVFEQQELIQTWIVYHLQIIGEAARATSQEFQARYPEVTWRDASDLRNLTIHEYFRINLEIIWDIVENDIPPLKQQIEAILQELI